MHVAESLLEQRQDVSVVQRVEDVPAGTTGADQPRGAQHAQLVRDGRLAHADGGREIPDAALRDGHGGDEADARGITEHAEGVGQRLGGLGREPGVRRTGRTTAGRHAGGPG